MNEEAIVDTQPYRACRRLPSQTPSDCKQVRDPQVKTAQLSTVNCRTV